MNAVAPKNLSQCKGIPIPEISRHFFLVESGKRLKESGIPLTIGVRNPNSSDKNRDSSTWNSNLRRGIQNPRLPWIPLRDVTDRSSIYMTIRQRMTIKELLIMIRLVVSYVEGGFEKLSFYKQPSGNMQT